MVEVYDFKTKRVTTIPATELAPGMVRARIKGMPGEYFIDATQGDEGDIRHRGFPVEVQSRIAAIHETFKDAYPLSLDDFELGFRKDTNARREISLWAIMRKAFLRFVEGRDLRNEQRKDIFDVVLATVNNRAENVIATVTCRTLSRKRIGEIANHTEACVKACADAMQFFGVAATAREGGDDGESFRAHIYAAEQHAPGVDFTSIKVAADQFAEEGLTAGEVVERLEAMAEEAMGDFFN